MSSFKLWFENILIVKDSEKAGRVAFASILSNIINKTKNTFTSPIPPLKYRENGSFICLFQFNHPLCHQNVVTKTPSSKKQSP
jgi:hypothetical protein